MPGTRNVEGVEGKDACRHQGTPWAGTRYNCKTFIAGSIPAVASDRAVAKTRAEPRVTLTNHCLVSDAGGDPARPRPAPRGDVRTRRARAESRARRRRERR